MTTKLHITITIIFIKDISVAWSAILDGLFIASCILEFPSYNTAWEFDQNTFSKKAFWVQIYLWFFRFM